MSNDIEITFDWKKILVPWQIEVFEAIKSIRFVAISAGRQSGKTHFCVILKIWRALTERDTIHWWVAPTYTPSEMAFKRARKYCIDRQIPVIAHKTKLTLTFKNDSIIHFKSADKEEGIRGETLDSLTIDEMGLIKRDAWLFALRGCITVKKAPVCFIGTPKGKNTFHEIYCKGQDPEETDYASFQFNSKANPYFSDEEWKAVQKLPQRVFEQEYLAEFIDDGGEVFRGIRDCIKGGFERKMNKCYYAGIDLAKSHDYTVIYILDETGHMVAQDRFNAIAWTIQKKRIIDLCLKYDAYALIDSTGLGDPILDDLLNHIRVEGYKFTNTTKRQLIENLVMGIERAEVTFPEIPELINELSIFEFEQNPVTGLIRYNAPAGMHDDCVIALALAYWAYSGTRGGTEIITDIGGRVEWEF